MVADPWHTLMALAGRQHQTFSTRQAVAAGIPNSTLTATARRMAITNAGHGVWACAGSPHTYERQLWLVQLSLGQDAIFTGRTALFLRRIITSTPRQIDIAVGPDLHLHRRPRVRYFRGVLHPNEPVVNLAGHRVPSVYRAFTDAAAVVPTESLVRWLPVMDRLRLGDLDGLAEYMRHRGRFVGIVNLRAAVVALAADLPHSNAERIARRHLRAAKAAPYPRPYPVRHEGRTIAEVDLAYPPVLYGVEVDGPHHLLPEVVEADKTRDRALTRLGWTIDRFPHDLVLNDPHAFVNEVLRGLAGAKSRYTAISHR